MSDIMRPVPFNQLVERVFGEYRNHGSVFGIRKENFYKPGKNRINVFDQVCVSALGPAAGPHTQLAQNIISSYLVGGRFIELKTVQIMDYLGTKKMISKPCIDARDEGFNVEWSTEFTLEKAYDEYLKAWFILILIQTLINGKFDKPDFIFNMSVGYNLEGIKQPRMQSFIDGLIDASSNSLFTEYKEQLNALIEEGEFFCGSDFEKNANALKGLADKVPCNICKSVTVSTMHGCPPEEIEAICSYMLKEKHLNTFVKLNPTLLGYNSVREILDVTGYDYIELKRESFEHDLQLDDAFSMLHKLMNLSSDLKLGFGVKLTNTLANVNNENIFEGDERYMSGRVLLPISTRVAYLISKEFDGKIPVSYSGGASVYSVKQLFECGIRPITLATDMLKPGGYARLKKMTEVLDSSNAWSRNTVDVDAIGKFSQDCLKADFVEKKFRGIDKAKTSDQLPLFNCFVSPCQEACPIHQLIPDYVDLVSKGCYEDALSLIYRDNALPGITCSICDHKCQLHCSRMDYEGAVEIRKMKRIAVEQGRKAYSFSIKGPSEHKNVKIAIVGAGPAGLSAAYFLAREGIKPSVFEKESKAGGVVANIIPQFRINDSVIKDDIDYIASLGVDFKFGIKQSDVTIDSLKANGFDYIVYAVGSEIGNTVKIDGDVSSVIDGLDFLKKYKLDEAKLGAHVIVEGAGNSAMDCARAATRCKGVEKVSVVYRRSVKEMPASIDEYNEAIKDGVDFYFLSNPKSLNDNELICFKMALGEKDSSGRRVPVETNDTFTLKCDNLILAVGEHVDSEAVSAFGIPLNEKGWPIVNPDTFETEVSSVFAIGDMSTGPSTVVRCIASAKAASAKILKDIGIESKEDEIADSDLSDEEFFDEEDRFFDEISEKKSNLMVNRNKDYDDFEKFARQEGRRCMNCTYLCSKCVDVCPNRANVAIDMRCSENSADAFQIIHLDAYCNECGNCATFCNHNGKPYKDKFTLFSRLDDFEDSSNQGFIVLGNEIRVRYNGNTVDCVIDGNGCVRGNVPVLIRELIEEIFISYGYLLGRVDE